MRVLVLVCVRVRVRVRVSVCVRVCTVRVRVCVVKSWQPGLRSMCVCVCGKVIPCRPESTRGRKRERTPARGHTRFSRCMICKNMKISVHRRVHSLYVCIEICTCMHTDRMMNLSVCIWG